MEDMEVEPCKRSSAPYHHASGARDIHVEAGEQPTEPHGGDVEEPQPPAVADDVDESPSNPHGDVDESLSNRHGCGAQERPEEPDQDYEAEECGEAYDGRVRVGGGLEPPPELLKERDELVGRVALDAAMSKVLPLTSDFCRDGICFGMTCYTLL